MKKHVRTTKERRQLEALQRKVAQWDETTKQDRQYGRRAGRRLRKWTGDSNDNTNRIANVLAAILDGCIHKEWSGGNYLAIEWAFERFWGDIVLGYVPTLRTIYARLVASHHTRGNAFVWNDLDYRAFYEPCKGRQVIVLDSQGRQTMCILESDAIKTRLHVRRLWPRTTKSGGRYLDGRDRGYLFSLEEILGGAKVDWAIHHFADIENTLSFVDSLKSELRL
jgi:hypothetical protein